MNQLNALSNRVEYCGGEQQIRATNLRQRVLGSGVEGSEVGKGVGMITVFDARLIVDWRQSGLQIGCLLRFYARDRNSCRNVSRHRDIVTGLGGFRDDHGWIETAVVEHV